MAWHINKLDTSSDVHTNYIQTKLNSGQSKIWHDIQMKVSVFLSSADLVSYKIEQFLQVLNIIHR